MSHFHNTLFHSHRACEKNLQAHRKNQTKCDLFDLSIPGRGHLFDCIFKEKSS